MLLLTTHQGRLPQGAPTSPYLANLALCFTGVVKKIEALCNSRKKRKNFRFSIYADDITISSRKDRISDRFIRTLIAVIEADGIFKVNPKKIRRNSNKYKAHKITGVVLTTDSKGKPRLTLPQKMLNGLRGRIFRMRRQLDPLIEAEPDFAELNQVLGQVAWLRRVCRGYCLPSAVKSEVFAFEETWKNYQGQRKAEYFKMLKELEEFLHQLIIQRAKSEDQRE
jgi:hypothetical protein